MTISPRTSRQRVPQLEAVENRFLLSALSSHASRRHVHHAAARSLPTKANTINSQSLPSSSAPSGYQVEQIDFHAVMSGTWQQGPGHFSIVSREYALQGSGSSNRFSSGSQQTRVVMPTDPAILATGVMTLVSDGSQLGLQIKAVPHTLDSQGRPTRFTYQVDQGLSNGQFAGEIGSGTVQVTYGPSSQPGQGTVTLLINGQVYPKSVA